MAENTTTYQVVVDTQVNGTEQLEGAGQAAESAGGQFQRLQTQIRETQKQLQAAAESGDKAKFDKLKNQLNDLQDKLEITQKRSLEFQDALAAAPGPVGNVGKALQGLDATFKSFLANPIVLTLAAIVGSFAALRESLSRTEEGQKKLNKISESFSKILNGLFAILEPIAFALADLVAGLLENESVMKGLSVTAGVLSATFTTVLNVAKSLGGFIVNNLVNAFKTLVGVASGAGKVLKGVFTFDLDLIKEGAAQVGDTVKKGFGDFVDNVKTTAVGIKDGVVQGVTEGFKAGETAFKEGSKRLTDAEKKAAEERRKKNAEAAKKLSEDEKKLAEQRVKDIEAGNKIVTEAYLSSLEERDREIYKRGQKLNEDITTLEKKREAQIADILKKAGVNISKVIDSTTGKIKFELPEVQSALKKRAEEVSQVEDEFNSGRINAQTAYRQDVANINKKFDDEETKKAEEKKQKEREAAKLAFEEALLANENAVQSVEQRYNREIALVNEKEKLLLQAEGLSEEQKNQIRQDAETSRLALQQGRYDELIAAVNEREQILLKNTELTEAQKTKIVLDAEEQRKGIEQARREDTILGIETELNDLTTSFDRRRELIAQKEQELLNQQNLTENQRTAIVKQAAEERKAIDMAELEAKAELQTAYLDLASGFGSFLKEIAGKNKRLAIAGVIVEQAAAIGKIIVNTGIANAKAVAASPLTGGLPWVAINTATAALSIASSVAAGIKAIQQINSADSGAPATGGGTNIPKAAGASAPAPTAPSVAGERTTIPQIVGTTGQASPGQQIAQTLASRTGQPVRAYVVSGDITSQQALDRRTTRAATFSGGTNG